jgi:asparagine synthase (glutamine-hydrolysing)
MCGISGVVYKTPQKSVNDLVLMNNTIKHRGPDDEGFVVLSNEQLIVAGGEDTNQSSWGQNTLYQPLLRIEDLDTPSITVGLGHRRLSILDLSPTGHQPMCSNTKRYWITFNGEIFNYIELREELKSLGYVFSTGSDTEVILFSYQHWGEHCQEKFNGMWSFVIYDHFTNEIFLSRDRFGIKPLYYWISKDNDFYFGSEIKQFTVCKGWNANLNHQRAYDYLFYALTDHTDETMFDGVFQIPAGCCFKFNIAKNNISFKKKIDWYKWYIPAKAKAGEDYTKAKVKFLDLYKSAIELHLRSDVSIGSALSGGLDSSAIVSYINILLKNEDKAHLQKTFSSCSTDERYDERKWMEEVIKEYTVDAHFIYPLGSDVYKLTDLILWHQDEPYQSQSAFLGYHVFKLANENNVKVLLNGQGADEYLSGYGEFRVFRLSEYAKKGQFLKLIKGLKGNSVGNKINDFLVIVKYITSGFFSGIRGKHHHYKNEILNSINLQELKVNLEIPVDGSRNSIYDIANKQIYQDPLPRYLRWEDRNSMAHSIEARVPFLDYRLVEYCMNLPVDFLDADNKIKRILTDSLIGILPEAIRNRKDKKGFITPEKRWMMQDNTEEFRKMLTESVKYSDGILNPEALNYFDQMANGKIEFSYGYWRLIQFGRWMNVFNIKK